MTSPTPISISAVNARTSSQSSSPSPQQQWTFAGALQFLQKEHRHFESSKSLWELERGELQVRISLDSAKITTLETYCKSHDKIQYDLLRRIKMLEVALRNERYKYNLLVDHLREHDAEATREFIASTLDKIDIFRLQLPSPGSASQPSVSPSDAQPETVKSNAQPLPDLLSKINGEESALNQPKSSKMLRQFLSDIQMVDAWMLMETSATQQLASGQVQQGTLSALRNIAASNPAPATAVPQAASSIDTVSSPAPVAAAVAAAPAETPLPAVEKPVTTEKEEAAILANAQAKFGVRKADVEKMMARSLKKGTGSYYSGSGGLSSASSSAAAAAGSAASTTDSSKQKFQSLLGVSLDDKKKSKSSSSSSSQGSAGQASSPSDASQQPAHSWKSRFVLQSHLDGVRSVSFHPREAVLLSASEDGCVKLWNLTKISRKSSSSSSGSVISQPVHTFRGHIGPVFSTLFGSDGNVCFSAGADGDVRVWDVPALDAHPYTNHGLATPFVRTVLKGHTDVVWSLSQCPARGFDLLLSASADGSVKLWSYENSNDSLGCLRQSFVLPTSTDVDSSQHLTPTHVSYLAQDHTKFVVSYTDSTVALFDAIAAKCLWRTKTAAEKGTTTYLSVPHPTMHSLLLSANEDKRIRLLDMTTGGSCTADFIAHQDAVTSVSVDPSGLYYMSGGHDSCVRIWDISAAGRCVQDISMPHRKKYDESVHCVQYHPGESQTLAASAGADGRVVLYQ